MKTSTRTLRSQDKEKQTAAGKEPWLTRGIHPSYRNGLFKVIRGHSARGLPTFVTLHLLKPPLEKNCSSSEIHSLSSQGMTLLRPKWKQPRGEDILRSGIPLIFRGIRPTWPCFVCQLMCGERPSRKIRTPLLLADRFFGAG